MDVRGRRPLALLLSPSLSARLGRFVTAPHLQLLCCLVEVQDPILRLFDEVQELFGQHAQAAVEAAAGAVGRRGCWVGARGAAGGGGRFSGGVLRAGGPAGRAQSHAAPDRSRRGSPGARGLRADEGVSKRNAAADSCRRAGARRAPALTGGLVVWRPRHAARCLALAQPRGRLPVLVIVVLPHGCCAGQRRSCGAGRVWLSRAQARRRQPRRAPAALPG